jgi:L-histidine Nalpha-methyltransferase
MRRAPDRSRFASRGSLDTRLTAAGEQSFADAVRFYLQLEPRQLPSHFLYDALGSALFDAICHLPWYKVTRAEFRLLERHAADLGRVLGDHARVVELGSGNGEKLATLLRHSAIARVHAHLIDVSPAALMRAQQALTAVSSQHLTVSVHEATYEDGLLALQRDTDDPTLMAFLGSNIGNFDVPDASAFLRLIRASLRPGDYLLLGVDLVKPERHLLLAYDDPLGLTAVFNKNLLQRINSELGGNFDLDRFRHRAVWNRDASRVEMHLVSLTDQEVSVPRADLTLRLGRDETIWTESSYKYEPKQIAEMVEPAGFVLRQRWIETDDRFALALFDAV